MSKEVAWFQGEGEGGYKGGWRGAECKGQAEVGAHVRLLATLVCPIVP